MGYPPPYPPPSGSCVTFDFTFGEPGDSYLVRCACGNCGMSGAAKIPVGVRAPVSSPKRCPHCGCVTVTRTW